MSVNTVTVECESCGASFSSNVITGCFVYELEDGNRIPLDRAYGWCRECNRMVAVEDLSAKQTVEALSQLRRRKEEIEQRVRNSFFSAFKSGEKQRIQELNKEIGKLERKLAFLRSRNSPAKCLTCGSQEIELLPWIPRPAETNQPIPAGWNHPTCGGRMFAVLQDYRLSFSSEPIVYDKNGIAKIDGDRLSQTRSPIEPSDYPSEEHLEFAEEKLNFEFGIVLDDVPEKFSVIALFKKLSTEAALSQEACVALLYRLVAMNFLGASKLMRDSGQDTEPKELLWLTDLLDVSIDWSEAAEDHIALETITSKLNMNIQSFMQSFGISGYSS